MGGGYELAFVERRRAERMVEGLSYWTRYYIWILHDRRAADYARELGHWGRILLGER